MRDTFAEETAPRKLCVGVDLGVVARQTGKVDNVGFGNCAPYADDGVAQRELFEVAAARRVGLWHAELPCPIEELERLTMIPCGHRCHVFMPSDSQSSVFRLNSTSATNPCVRLRVS